MKLSEFDFQLPEELIAQKPISVRDQSRLLVLDKLSGALEHRHFYEVIDHLQADDILVVNDSSVFPARLYGAKKETGGSVEIFLNHEIGDGNWQVIGKNLKIGHTIIFANSSLEAQILSKKDETYIVKFNLFGAEFFEEIEKFGAVPLPPYIKREKGTNLEDKNRYQTVYANEKGSAAAPTAGLHFTPELISKIQQKGIKILHVTLHVGLGTFAPIKTDNIEEHNIHSEFYSVESNVVEQIIQAKQIGGSRIIAVGTTSARVLEHIFREKSEETKKIKNDKTAKLSGWTKIFIYPGYKFQCIDGLITNFHLPKSSLLMLVSALAGSENIKNAYKVAIAEQYRFFSYGDAMLIL
ncbi:MAG: tRNA preQ1(34) S-adenosylmethionine ribosyltransferase-isomerase QueA [bacterium]